MTLEQAKQFIATHTNPAEMTTQQIDDFKRAVEIVAGAWAQIPD